MATNEAQQETQFEDSPRGLAQRWQFELKAAKDYVKEWQDSGEKVIRRFLDKRDAAEEGESRLNLFTSNVITLRSMLYGRPPRAQVSRRFADAQDDVARVAGEILERHINTDIEDDGDGFVSAMACCIDDRLLPGLAVARVRYEAEFEDVGEVPAKVSQDEDGAPVELAPAVPATQRKVSEDVDIDYIPWRDFLWSPCRFWGEVRWVAFKADMSREALVERFGEEVGKAIPLKSAKKDSKGNEAADPWARAEVWEIWCKESESVYWYVDGYPDVLDTKPDPLGLDGFFPCAKPMAANLTTSAFLPRPDYVLAQDIYNEVDTVRTRITLLERAIRVVGVYDKANGNIRRVLSDSADNEMVPVDNWAAFAEKGGMRGAVDWMPLDQVVAALQSLRDYSAELMDLLYQVTGMSDIMRGQAASAGTSATEQSIKAKFGSVRVQAMQDEFARFASETLALKAEIIAKHYEPSTIVEVSNMQRSYDAQVLADAVALIKNPEGLQYRVEVKPEAISLQDFAALRGERMELLQGVAGFLQAAGPMAAQMPTATPFLLQMLQWTVAGFRGASQIEGVLDQAIAQAQTAAQQPQQAQPDTKLLALQAKSQGELAKVQAELQADLVRTQADVQADAQREENQARWNVREQAAKTQLAQATRATMAPRKPFGA